MLEFVLTTPALRADDTTPGVYKWVGPNHTGGDGDVTVGNNWDPDDTGPPGGSVPGKKDSVLVSPVNDSFGTHITLSGNLDVGSASIGGATMTGTVTVVGGLSAGTDSHGGGDTIFEKSVAANRIGSSGATFHKAVTASGATNTGLQFDVGSGSNNFVQGSSLMVDHALGIGTSANGLHFPTALNFSGAATGIVHQAGQIIPTFNVPSTTAAFVEDGSTFHLSGSGTQFTVDGDFLVGLRFSLPFNLGANAAVNVTDGAKLITTGKTIVGPWFANTQETVNGGGEMMIEGVSSQWLAQGDVIVGGPRRADGDPGSTGAVTISFGGALDATSHEIVLATAPGSLGTLNVQDTNSIALSNSIIVGSLGTGTLLVKDGGTLHNTGVAIVGQLPGGIGNATVTGTGAKWQIDGDLTVGSSGIGTVAVADNGLLHTNGAATLGLLSGSNGTVSVGDMNSKWQTDTTLTIGSFGTGTLNIENQGLVQSTGAAVLGEKTGGSGTATVTGMGSQWQLATNLTIGSLGTGTLNVQSQGLVHTTGDVTIGEQAGGNGTATITDMGSQWQIDGNLVVGLAGTGTLNVENGAQMDQGGKSLNVGQLGGSTGTLHVTGGGSSYTSDNLTIGSLGTGNLKIENMGFVQTTMQAVVGLEGTAMGTATIDGAGSKWQVDGNLVIGENGDGSKTSSVTISSGGLLAVNGSLLTIGQENGSIGILAIDGKDSKLLGTGAAKVEIGRHGNGTLQLSNGGSLTLNSVVLGALDGGKGTVKVDGIASGTPSSFSTLGAFTIGGVANATGVLTVSNGGLVTTSGSIIIGRDANSIGNVLLIGQGSAWDLTGGTGNLTVGQAGTGSLTVTSNASLSLGTLTVAETSPNGSVTVSNGGFLSIAGAVTEVGESAGSVGTMNVNSSGSVMMRALILGDLASSSGSLAIAGTGSTDTKTSVTATSLRVGRSGHGDLTVSNGATLIDTGNTFRIEGSNSRVTVDGLGSSLYADGAILFARPGSQTALTISSQGLVRTAGGIIDNGSGVKVLDANSKWEIGNFGLNLGGSSGNGFLLVDAGAVTVNSAVTLGSSNFGQVLVKNSGSLTVTGGNSIVIGDQAKAELSMFGGAQVSAAGAVVGQGSNLNILGAGAQLTVNALSVGRGASDTGILSVDNGHISANLLLVNQGSRVSVTGGSIDLGLAGAQADPGKIIVRPGGTLKDNGAVFADVVNVFNLGTVGGSGTINGKLINGGKVSPGDPQTLTVNGDYQQLNGGLLQIAIAGKTMPEFDHLNVTGHVTLDMGAKLELDFMNGFAPKMGDKFDFLQSGDAVITDNFSEVVITGLEPGFQFVLTPDGVGSFGLVALNDGVPTTVPEPNTYAMLILGGALLLRQFRRRRG